MMNKRKPRNYLYYLRHALFSMLVALLSGCGGDDSPPASSGDNDGNRQGDLVLQALHLETTHDIIPQGLTTPLRAVAVYEGGYVKDVTDDSSWSSSDESVLSVKDGSITANHVGEAEVTVAFEGISSMHPMKVVDGEVVQVSISPQFQEFPAGYQTIYQAELEYLIDGVQFSYPVSDGVQWSVSDTNIATIDQQGVLDAKTSGDVDVSVSFISPAPVLKKNSSSQLLTSAKLKVIELVQVMDIEITGGDDQSVPINGVLPLTAMASVKDSQNQITQLDVTDLAVWTSSDTSKVTVDPYGQVMGILQTQGSPVPVTAELSVGSDKASDSVAINVTDKTLQNIVILPSTVGTHVGERTQLKAQGFYDNGTVEDLTDQVQWSSSDDKIVSVDNLNSKGQISALAEGQGIVIEALDSAGSQLVGTATIVVDGFLGQIQSIEITPKSASAHIGDTLRYQAIATLDDGQQSDITSLVDWQVAGDSNVIIGSGNAQAGELQILTGVSASSVTVSASFSTYSDSTTLAINPAVLQQVLVKPMAVRTPVGGSHTFLAKGLLSDGSIVALANVNWNSNATGIVSVDPTSGVATALALGRARISVEATLNGVTKTSVIPAIYEVEGTLGDATSLSLQSDLATVPLGGLVQFTSEATMTDNDVYDVTAQASLVITPPGRLVEVNGVSGLYRAIGTGDVSVTSSLNSLISQPVQIKVESAELKRVRLSPSSQMLPVGSSMTLSIFGVYGDGQEVQMSNADFSWVSDSSSVMVSSTGQITAVNSNSAGATITAINLYDTSLVASAQVYVPTQTVKAIDVLPGNVSLVKGERKALQALATLDGGQQIDVTSVVSWSSDKPSDVSVVLPGLIQGEEVTTGVDVYAELTTANGNIEGRSSVEVTDAKLERILVSPMSRTVSLGEALQYTATGYYSDKSQANLTAQASWVTDDSSLASINTDGLLVGLAPGQTKVTATFSGVDSVPAPVMIQSGSSDIVTVTKVDIIEPGLDLPINTEYSLSVNVTYIDSQGRTRNTNLPSLLSWSTSDLSKVVVSDNGTVEGVALDSLGQVVTASFGGQSDSLTVTVNGKSLDRIEVLPSSSDIPLVGLSQQMQAIGHYDNGSTLDLTSQVAWTDDDTTDSVVTLSDKGIVTAVADGGPVMVTASYGLQGNSASLTVGQTPMDVMSIDVVPADLDLVNGATQRYQALANMDNGASLDVTSMVDWQVSQDTGGNTVATIFSHGTQAGELLTQKVSSSTVNVTAQLGGVSGVGTLDVTDEILERVALSPGLSRLGVGAQKSYIATGYFSDGTQSDITGSTTFGSNSAAVTVNGDTITGVAKGDATITSTTTVGSQMVTSKAYVTVEEVPLTVQSLRVEPSTLSLPVTDMQRVSVIATLSDTSETNVTSMIAPSSWQSTSSTVAYKSTSDTDTIVAGTATGTATLTVPYLGKTATLTVTTTNATLDSITLTPASQTLPLGTSSSAYQVTGHYNDGSTATLDNTSLDWVSTNPEVTVVDGIVSVSNSAAPNTPVTITVTEPNSQVSGRAIVHVLDATVSSLRIIPAGPLTLKVGESHQLEAELELSDGTILNATSMVEWGHDPFVSVDETGLLTAIATSHLDAAVTAKLGSTWGDLPLVVSVVANTDLKHIVISPTQSTVGAGLTQQYTATGHYMDKSTLNITDSVAWSSGDSSVATIASDGVVTGIASGTTSIMATHASGVPVTPAQVMVEDQIDWNTFTLDDITVTQGAYTRAKASVETFSGKLLDVSTSLSNISFDNGYGLYLKNGVIQGVTAGSDYATAVIGSHQSNKANVAVNAMTPVVERLELTPDGQVITQNSASLTPYRVYAYYNSDPDIAVDVTNDPETILSVDGSFITNVDKATGIATAGSRVSGSGQTGWVKAEYGGFTSYVQAHVWSQAAPIDICNTNGNNAIEIDGGYKVACPATKSQLDMASINPNGEDIEFGNAIYPVARATEGDDLAQLFNQYCDYLSVNNYAGRDNWQSMASESGAASFVEIWTNGTIDGQPIDFQKFGFPDRAYIHYETDNPQCSGVHSTSIRFDGNILSSCTASASLSGTFSCVSPQ
ncbi:Ig-like domain-containing protein [Vibrio sp. S4M6]|uniref:Ig-like domain-containing protein n=1 Tax=Vibrio sinus TaxID=2946865 RepID=UPI00202A39BE|nr:Ig-like domain-containing protein [Vibrio sinus]MCL9782713.1 Ig-like domain-containing protein [Vibrio sinus]